MWTVFEIYTKIISFQEHIATDHSTSCLALQRKQIGGVLPDIIVVEELHKIEI